MKESSQEPALPTPDWYSMICTVPSVHWRRSDLAIRVTLEGGWGVSTELNIDSFA